MPYRKGALERGTFVVMWQQDLDSNPAANRARLLAYSDGGLLSWLGLVWGCRGDLQVERLAREEIVALRLAKGWRP
jgi:hypothetical protein